MQPFFYLLLYTLLSIILNCFGIVPQINSQTVRGKVYKYEGTIRVYLFLIVPQIKSLSWYMHIKEQHEHIRSSKRIKNRVYRGT